jgi:hypothetical protein
MTTIRLLIFLLQWWIWIIPAASLTHDFLEGTGNESIH